MFFRKAVAGLWVILSCAAAFAQSGGPPKIAVSVTGDLNKSESRALGTEILDALVKSGRYIAVERAETFVAAIEQEHITQRSGAVDDSQISALGKQFGADFICVADVAEVFDAHQMSARILNVETMQVVAIGKAAGTLNSVGALMVIANAAVNNMFDAAAGQAAQPAGFNNEAASAAAANATDPPEMTATFNKIPMVVNGFTMDERRRAEALNLIPGGWGSLFIQQDYVGALIGGGTYIAGLGFIVSGYVNIFDLIDRYPGGVPPEKEDEAIGALVNVCIGGVLLNIGVFYSMMRPRSYKKPAPKMTAAAVPVHNFGISVLPDANGNVKAYASYNMEF